MLSSILLLNNVIPGFKENIAEEMQKNNIIRQGGSLESKYNFQVFRYIDAAVFRLFWKQRCLRQAGRRFISGTCQ